MRSLDEHQSPLQLSNDRDLQLLSEIETNPEATQRQIASRMGIALGLTNVLIRNLAQKGYVRATKAGWKRWFYAITPDGFTQKIRLTVDYVHRVLHHYQSVRQTLREQMEPLSLNEESRVAIYGATEFAELVYLGLKELGITEIDVYDSPSRSDAGTFLGMPVRDVETLDSSQYDRVMFTLLQGSGPDSGAPEEIGVPPGKFVTFFTGGQRGGGANGH